MDPESLKTLATIAGVMFCAAPFVSLLVVLLALWLVWKYLAARFKRFLTEAVRDGVVQTYTLPVFRQFGIVPLEPPAIDKNI